LKNIICLNKKVGSVKISCIYAGISDVLGNCEGFLGDEIKSRRNKITWKD
jgi:hypothetical protein